MTHLTPDTLAKAEAALIKLDPVLGAIIPSQQLKVREGREDYFASLSHSILGQQVSVAAARAITSRFDELTQLNPAKVAGLNEEACKVIGLSRQKAGYLRDLGAHFAENPAIYDHLDTLSDEDVIKELTAVKGIGVWTAQMFLLFTLARPDIFAPDDVGLQKGIMKLYRLDTLPPKKELAVFAERWAPYRSVASLHLWHSLDNMPD